MNEIFHYVSREKLKYNYRARERKKEKHAGTEKVSTISLDERMTKKRTNQNIFLLSLLCYYKSSLSTSKRLGRFKKKVFAVQCKRMCA
uniref:Uncharacterized protein n=1 Tax=Romanomermis culicivorax TaxID=13658 RepID=A0A915I4C4_ROMCU